jgi:hypothetical protein
LWGWSRKGGGQETDEGEGLHFGVCMEC